ncbi:hypothetical protein MBLNU457_1508t1 [Dothideomycetes sp. NU457]
MRPATLLLPLAAAYASASHIAKRDYSSRDYYAVHLPSHVSVAQLAERIGLSVHGPLGELEDHWLLEGPKSQQDVLQDAVTELKRRRWKRDTDWRKRDLLDDMLLGQKQVARRKLFKRQPIDLDKLERDIQARQGDHPVDSHLQHGLDIAAELGIKDPIFPEQWHLYNAAQIGHDINVTGVWQQGITGKGSISCIVDDGLDFGSDDLKDNYFAEGSFDFNDPGPDPLPRLDDDRHGTRCAGEVAAVRNDVCGVGVAYDSKVAGVRILSGVISDADEAIALNYAYQDTQIYSCSWGPPDDGRSMEAPGVLIARSMLTGIQKGRGGLGSLFVFAIGNGAFNDDNCNFDGYTNSIYSVSVGGIDRKGLHPYYSEKCSAQLVVTYSSGSGDAIHTTDVGKSNCYTNHGGTSAAGPLVVGAYALVLEVRPDLHWRDFQYITLLTAIPIDTENGWQDTAIGRKFSHQYGFGKMDTWALVEMAKNWTSVKPQAWYFSPWMHVRHDIPQGAEGLSSTFDVTPDMLKDANLERVEHVTVTMNVQHTRRGDLSAELISPFGVTSHIATARRNDNAASGYVDWTFMSVAHWGESGVGTWTVVLKDTNVNDFTGHFVDWRLRLWGECIDPKIQTLLPLPTDHDDDDHDTDIATAIVSTTTHGDTHPTGEPQGNPDDHIDRPVNAKPTTTEAAAVPTNLPTDSPPVPSVTPGTEGEANKEEEKPNNFLPSPFPTFGVRKGTQGWIYGALGLITVFCISLAAWYFITSQRKRRNARDEYEFEMLNENDADDDGAHAGPGNGANGFGNGGAKGKRRAAELYDAFAENSEEEDVFSIGDEEAAHEDQERYRDDDDGHKDGHEKERH